MPRVLAALQANINSKPCNRKAATRHHPFRCYSKSTDFDRNNICCCSDNGRRHKQKPLRRECTSRQVTPISTSKRQEGVTLGGRTAISSPRMSSPARNKRNWSSCTSTKENRHILWFQKLRNNTDRGPCTVLLTTALTGAWFSGSRATGWRTGNGVRRLGDGDGGWCVRDGDGGGAPESVSGGWGGRDGGQGIGTRLCCSEGAGSSPHLRHAAARCQSHAALAVFLAAAVALEMPCPLHARFYFI